MVLASMRKGVLSIFICLIFIAQATAQKDGDWIKNSSQNFKKKNIIGNVIDGNSFLPLEYATISILSIRDSSLINGGITDDKGYFQIEAGVPAMILKLEFLGYETIWKNIEVDKGKSIFNAGEIALMPQSEVLENIEIRAEKSESQFSLDKQIFNVGKDLANQGGTAEDILDNVPSVTVDVEGQVSLRGSTGVRILVDGKPSGLLTAGNANGLRSITANTIDRIEVITNPSARYEAEGMAGIINIILKKNKNAGFNGSFDVTLGYPRQMGLGANLNYRKGKLNWFANYAISLRENPGEGFEYQERLSNDSLFTVDQNRITEREGLTNSIRFGADYFFNDKEQVTFALSYAVADEANTYDYVFRDYLETGASTTKKLDPAQREIFFSNTQAFSSTRRFDDEFEDEKNLDYSLNYSKKLSSDEHKINTLVQFTDRTEVEGSDISEKDLLFITDEIKRQRSNNDEGNQTWLFQMDYVHPISKEHKWEAGLRSTLREIRNNFLVEDNNGMEWLEVPEFTNEFYYNEDIYAAYGIYGNKWRKISYQAGLRLEYADITTRLLATEQNGVNARSFLNLFPSGHINYRLSEANAFQISYSRRTVRPRFWDLNPFFTFSNPRNFFSGNPNVNPEFTDSYELSNINYWENMNFTTAVFYRTTDQSIQRVMTVDNQEGSSIRFPINVGVVQDLGLDLNLSYSGIKKLRLDLNANFFRNSLDVDNLLAEQKVIEYFRLIRNFRGTTDEFNDRYSFSIRDVNSFTWTGRLTARISLFGTTLQLRGNYRAPVKSGQGIIKHMGTLDLGWSKDFLDRKLTLTLAVRDLFNSRRRRGEVEFDDFFADAEGQWRSRSTALTLSYRLNQKPKGKPEGKKSWNQ